MDSKLKQDNSRLKQDLNFLEYPMWALSKGLFKECHLPRKDEPHKTYQVFMYKQKNFTVETIQGIPVFFDAIVLMFLLKQVQENNFSTKIINLSFYKIVKGCGFSCNSRYYKKVEASLNMWSTTTFRFDDSFVVKTSEDVQPNREAKKKLKKYRTFNCSPIDSWGITEIDNKQKLFVRMGDEFIKSIKESNFCKYIDFDEYKKFSSPLAARLNELLCKNFFKRLKWEIGIKKLAEKLTLQQKYPSKIYEKIIPALKQVNKINKKQQYSIEKKENADDIYIFRLIKKKFSINLDKFIDLIPVNQRNDCEKICLKILKDQGEDALFFYLKQTKTQDEKVTRKSWGATIQSAIKRQDFEKHQRLLKKQQKKEQQEKEDQRKKEILVIEKEKQAHAEQIQKMQFILAMNEEENSEFEAWIRTKKKMKPKQTIKDGSKIMNLYTFWETVKRSYPIRIESKQDTLFS
ncbi:MAG: hypothetical protein GY730_06590 [bacterium]|nr:hypothetical protein [bacterium]